MNIKKIVAREGLVLIGIVLLGFLVHKGSLFLNNIINKPTIAGEPSIGFLPNLVFEPFASISDIGINIAVYGFPVYLLVRFIIWAIRTLRKKE